MALLIGGPGSVLFVFSPVLECCAGKIYLASWLLSADTATNARASKAIGGRFYDRGDFRLTSRRFVSIGSIDRIAARHSLQRCCTIFARGCFREEALPLSAFLIPSSMKKF
jgi:hypothetical protein